jgi:hypothetical protein
MFSSLFRRRQQRRPAITPTEARDIVAQKLQGPDLTPLERGILMQIAAHCEPHVTPSVLSEQQRDRVKAERGSP